MREKIDLTVIIPNHNKEKYIVKCIESVLQQTILPKKIIIIDDCSTDRSIDKIFQIEDNENIIRVIPLKENVGVSKARNIGILEAQTQYITCLDSDDFYANRGKLENEWKLIEKNQGCIAYSKLALADEEDNVQYPQINRKKYIEGNIYKRLITGRFSLDAMIRDYVVDKNMVIESGMYNESRNLYEDLELLIKLSMKYEFLCTGEFGSAYRQTGTGLSNRKRAELITTRNQIIKECLPSERVMATRLLAEWRIRFWADRMKGRGYSVYACLYRLLKGRN